MAGGPAGPAGCFIPVFKPATFLLADTVCQRSLHPARHVRGANPAHFDSMFDYENNDCEDDGLDEVQDYRSGPVGCATNANIRELVESVVDVVRWHDDYAECVCPYGHKDAHLYLNGAIPYLHCLHERCRADVAEVNGQLRELAGANLSSQQWEAMFKPDKMEQARRKRLALIRAQARNRLLPSLLKKGKPVTRDDWLARSPFPLAGDVRDDWSLFIRALYQQRDPAKPDDWQNQSDLLWVGELWESGKPEYRRCFKRVHEWLRYPGCPGSQICVAPFNDNCSYRGQYLSDTWRRSKHWARLCPYYVAESDMLEVERFGIVVEYLQRFSTLRAIVDTAGKSFHAWFDVPSPPRCPVQRPAYPLLTPEEKAEYRWASEGDRWRHDGKAAATLTRLTAEIKEREAAVQPSLDAWNKQMRPHLEKHERRLQLHRKRVDELYAVAEGLGCDRMMFRVCPTARLPGCERLDSQGQPTGRWQSLLYLNPKHPITT